jgi:hypothetical protein
MLVTMQPPAAIPRASAPVRRGDVARFLAIFVALWIVAWLLHILISGSFRFAPIAGSVTVDTL